MNSASKSNGVLHEKDEEHGSRNAVEDTRLRIDNTGQAESRNEDDASCSSSSSSSGRRRRRVNPQDATLPLHASSHTNNNTNADFAVTVHDDEAAEQKKEPSKQQQQQQQQQPHANAAEASPPVSLSSLGADDEDNEGRHKKQKKNSKQNGHRPRGRRVQLETTVLVEVNDPNGSSATVRSLKRRRQKQIQQLPLPLNQYECTLYRRAIRKQEDEQPSTPTSTSSKSSSSSRNTDGVDDSDNKISSSDISNKDDTASFEIYGDISLGMKLTVVSGKVIVQKLNALVDGRASPAQLAGVIRRGDVLLSINHSSLVNLPIDQLMKGLSPLSTPDNKGTYQRELQLRFASGEGLALLEKTSRKGTTGAGTGTTQQALSDAASDMFILFPMVDQLSGMPLFPQQEEKQALPPTPPPLPPPPSSPLSNKSMMRTNELSLDDAISADLARDRLRDRDLFVSLFFAWKDDDSGNCLLLKQLESQDKHNSQATTTATVDPPAQHSAPLTLSQLVERGRRAILGAKALADRVEKIDRGKFDVRSFKSWKSTLSQYSRASAKRRRVVFDAASVPVNFGRVVEESDEDDSSGSGGGDSDDGVEPLDADEVLLRLAAHDEAWRKQAVDFLEKAMHEEEAGGDLSQQDLDEEKEAAEDDMTAALTNELGSFLFGENMTKILSKRKKPQALPPEEITSVLFDLTTKISATIPDEIAAAGDGSYDGRESARPIAPFSGTQKFDPEGHAFLASRFLLDEALPAWLRSFRPLPLEQRRVLWPLDKPLSGGGSTVSSTLSDDSFTLESVGGASQLSPASRVRTRKNLRERIEEQELDAGTRVETCFLATYYFSQKLLPTLARNGQSDNDDDPDSMLETSLEKILDFIKEYGSYLRLHTCLAYSALLGADRVIDSLLDVAKHDPSHKEMIKHTGKANSLVFYEPAMLSAVIQKLQNLRQHFAPDQGLAIIDICVSAYPDIQPWQVKKECLVSRRGSEKGMNGTSHSNGLTKKLEDLYYIYLSLLLHPMDGNELARRDHSLVKEWCELSVHQVDNGTFRDRSPDRLKNFYSVASRTSSDHLSFARDLVLLLKISKEIGEVHLVLDIAGEILESSDGEQNADKIRLALDYLRDIGAVAVESFEADRSASARKLMRILRIYRSAVSCSSTIIHDLLDVPNELLNWLLRQSSSPTDPIGKTLRLIHFLADEATPSDVLEAAQAWAASSEIDSKAEILPVLHTVIRRAAGDSRSIELSGALLRLKRARLRLNLGDSEHREATQHSDDRAELHIWRRMSTGMVAVLK